MIFKPEFIKIICNFCFSFATNGLSENKMVAKIICVACSLEPEVHTTEITFHKFPNNVENVELASAWANALSTNTEKSIDGNLKDIFICSRHFTSDDFEFVDGKLILKPGAIPSIFVPISAQNLSLPKILQTQTSSEDTASNPDKNWMDTPTTAGANFAWTSTINQMTTSRNNILTLPSLTDTPKVLTPSFTEYIPTASDINAFEKINGKLSNDAKKALKDSRITIRSYKKRNLLLQRKYKSLTKLVIKMRDDKLLTEDYISKLQVNLIDDFFT